MTYVWGLLYCNYFRNVLAGIIAFGIGCGQSGIPDIFASVQDALCFIDYDIKCKHGREFIQHIDFDRECNTFLFHLFIYNVWTYFYYISGNTWFDKQVKQWEDVKRSFVKRILRKFTQLKTSCVPKTSFGLNPRTSDIA